jgi:hypothetical protein
MWLQHGFVEKRLWNLFDSETVSLGVPGVIFEQKKADGCPPMFEHDASKSLR